MPRILVRSCYKHTKSNRENGVVNIVWIEFNIHIRNRIVQQQNLFYDSVAILLDLVKPLVDSQRERFSHWHYLIEPDTCRGQECYETRLRFEGSETNIGRIKGTLVTRLNNYVNQTHRVMSETEPLGSHEGCHGCRGENYLGSQSENFGRDWNTIVEILQNGSEHSLNVFSLGRTLVENRSVQLGQWRTIHPYYIHLPANQLIVE